MGLSNETLTWLSKRPYAPQLNSAMGRLSLREVESSQLASTAKQILRLSSMSRHLLLALRHPTMQKSLQSEIAEMPKAARYMLLGSMLQELELIQRRVDSVKRLLEELASSESITLPGDQGTESGK